MNETAQQPPQTLTEILRVRFKRLLDPVGAFLNRLGIAPNTLTLTGLAGNLVGAIFLARGQFLIGGLILLFMGPLDALDGTMARLRGEPTAFGGLIDSVTDRYSELIIYGGLLLHYALLSDVTMSMIAFAAASGSVLVSYARARAQSLGYEAKGGLLTRAERFIVLIPSLILGYPRVGLWLVAIFANLTAIQRILSVRRQAR
ncbi:MAG: CDP-alcohol phosphatidyltransferase family protein [Anaerolineales bacterium]